MTCSGAKCEGRQFLPMATARVTSGAVFPHDGAQLLKTCGGKFFFRGKPNNMKVLDRVDNILVRFRLTDLPSALRFAAVAVQY